MKANKKPREGAGPKAHSASPSDFVSPRHYGNAVETAIKVACPADKGSEIGDAVADAIAENGTSWTSVRNAVWRAIVRHKFPGPFLPEEPKHGIETRCVRIALALTTGEPDGVHDDELPLAGRIADALGLTSTLAKRTPTTPSQAPVICIPDGQVVAVDVAFPWFSYDARPQAFHKGLTHIALRGVGADKTSVQLLLATPAGPIEIREYENRLSRPVLAPNSWKPISLAEFSHAMASGCEWRDHPRLRPPSIEAMSSDRTKMGLDDYAEQGSATTPADHAISNFEAARTVRNCDNLIAIGNGVWRLVPALTCRIVGDFLRQCATWEAGGLTGMDSQVTALEELCLMFGVRDNYETTDVCATIACWRAMNALVDASDTPPAPIAMTPDGRPLSPTTSADFESLCEALSVLRKDVEAAHAVVITPDTFRDWWPEARLAFLDAARRFDEPAMLAALHRIRLSCTRSDGSLPDGDTTRLPRFLRFLSEIERLVQAVQPGNS